MASFNVFISECDCPHCQALVRIEFQSNAGLLEQRDILVGERILPVGLYALKGVVGPDISVLIEREDFWTMGVGECPECRSEVWAKLFFVDEVFQGIEVHDEPENPFQWGEVE